MFSNRIQKGPTPNRLTAALDRQRAAGARITDLTESNPTASGFSYDAAEISRALVQPGSMLYEPHPRGLFIARQAIAEYYRDHGAAVDPESVVLASGTSEAYGHLFKLLAGPGDEILVPVPGYPLLEVLTALDSVRLLPYRHLYDEKIGWVLDTERLGNTVTNRTKAIVVVSPNNPTGAFLKKSDLAKIAELCRKMDLALIVDEVFSDYARGSDPTRVGTAAGHDGALTFALNGFSKIAGLPQLKLAWIVVNGPPDLRDNALEGLDFIADAYLSVSTPIQHAAPMILRGRDAIQSQILGRLEENDRILALQLSAAPGCRILKREGGWYAVVRLPDDVSDEEFSVRCLEDDAVLVHPGYFYDFPSGNHLVLSLLTPAGAFREGTAKIAARLQGMRRDGRVGP